MLDFIHAKGRGGGGCVEGKKRKKIGFQLDTLFRLGSRQARAKDV